VREYALGHCEVETDPKIPEGEVIYKEEGWLFYSYGVISQLSLDPLFYKPLVGLDAEIMSRSQVRYQHPPGSKRAATYINQPVRFTESSG
jgi:hypothetical protein